MWQKHGKKLLIGLMFAVITVAAAVLISYSSRHNYAANDQIEAYKRARTIEIHTVEDYLEFANSFTDEYNYDQWEVVLCSDLDFSGYENIPVIGDTSIDEDAMTFSGTFEGNGYKISNLHISNPGGRAAMFACLGGMVKNLRVESSSFSGNICGAISAEMYDGEILNCYVDAPVEGDVSGSITGICYGEIYNCVSATNPYGVFEHGKVEYCYLIGNEDIETLNRNLYNVSGWFRDASFCEWKVSEDGILSKDKMDLLESLNARLLINGKEFAFQGYYSGNDGRWYIALPATYGDSELYLEAKTSDGVTEKFKRLEGEAEILFTCGEFYYPIRFVSADNIDTICVTLEKHKDLDYIHANKIEEVPGYITIIHSDGTISYETMKGFYGHGNSSWESNKKSYNLKFDSYVDLLGMGANNDFALLAGYRLNSLMSYVANAELSKLIGFDYAPEYRLVNLFVGGEYAGVYFLTEKIELDDNRIDITNIYRETEKINTKALEAFEHLVWDKEETRERRHYYDVSNNPVDITGGYLLEKDICDYEPYESRFSTYEKKSQVVLKRAPYSSEEQVNYIADYWQEFEDALFSVDGRNTKGKYYTEYIDLESYTMQWLMYELSQEDSIASSVYFYKESDVDGDGKLHACYPWDLERSFKSLDNVEVFGHVDDQGDYWKAFYKHKTFREEVANVWQEKFIPAIDFMILNTPIENEESIKNLQWYLDNLGMINFLESSRWSTTDMYGKTELIKEILSIRKEVITSALLAKE